MDTMGSYTYKTWTIWGKSDYNKTWFCEPNFLFDLFPNYKDIDNFIINNRIYDDNMTTLSKTKHYLKENGDIIKNKLIKELELLTK